MTPDGIVRKSLQESKGKLMPLERNRSKDDSGLLTAVLACRVCFRAVNSSALCYSFNLRW
ncbi:MAG: hypothetical protein ACJAQT_000365 [Akkermansiaceae bacterium]|jgi:hypothetical protein